MALAGVNVNLVNGQLGRVAALADRVCGLIVAIDAASAPSGITVGEPTQVFTLDQVEALGIDADYDSNNAVQAYQQIAAFYNRAGNGRELWIYCVDKGTLQSAALDNTGNEATKLLDAAGGRIKMLGCTSETSADTTATGGLDADVATAIVNADVLAKAYAAKNMPVRVIVEGRAYDGTAANLADLTENTNNRVGVYLGSDDGQNGNATVGRLLGRLASVPPQRSAGRVKDGDIGLVNCYLSDGTSVRDIPLAELASIAAKGYIVPRYYLQGKSGFFFSNPVTASAATDDYHTITNGRVIDKMHSIAYSTYLEEILDDVEVDQATGYLLPEVVGDYRNTIRTAINLQMANEISGVVVDIDPAQNIISTDKLVVGLRAVPKGYTKTIEVQLGLSNPAVN